MNQDKQDLAGGGEANDSPKSVFSGPASASQSEATELPRERLAEISGSDVAADNLPVPVLADTCGCDPACKRLVSAVEARESNEKNRAESMPDSRGGQNL